MSTPPRNQDRPLTPPASQLMNMTLITDPDEGVLADLHNTYVTRPGAPLCHAPCVLCRRPLANRPFMLHVLVVFNECPDGDGHLGSGAVARHVGCDPADDDDLRKAVERVLAHDHAS